MKYDTALINKWKEKILREEEPETQEELEELAGVIKMCHTGLSAAVEQKTRSRPSEQSVAESLVTMQTLLGIPDKKDTGEKAKPTAKPKKRKLKGITKR